MLSQEAMAKRMGIARDQLASVEYKRTRVTFGIAKFLCETFDINQRWLALGESPLHPKFDVSMESSVMVKYSSHFSWVFDNFLDHFTGLKKETLIEKMGKEAYEKGSFDDAVFVNFPPDETAQTDAMAWYLKKLINLRFASLPDDLKTEYGRCLLNAEADFKKKHEKQIGEKGKRNGKKLLDPAPDDDLDLTESATSSSLATDVKKQLPSLLERLKKATKETGKMSALANYLKTATGRAVPLASVSRWIAGSREPGGEIALQLLVWVELEERKT